MKKYSIFVFCVFILFFVLGCQEQKPEEKILEKEKEKVEAETQEVEQLRELPKESRYWEPITNNDVRAMLDSGIDYQAILKTNKGNIKIDLEEIAPITTTNFIKLAKNGFYDDSIFHRYEPGFVIQGGSLYGDGTGDPGYVIPDEINPRLSHKKFSVSMANAGVGTTSCQFFICLKDCPHLDGKFNIFGKVLEGKDVVMALRKGDKIEKVEIIELNK